MLDMTNIDVSIPNLDALDLDDLRAIDQLFTHLAIITDAMIRAREMRKLGDIQCAMTFERLVEHRYKSLPDSVKW